MQTKKSAGVLLYRIANKQIEVLLVHPGGPFWKNKDEGAWSIPKGEFTIEEPLEAAKREVHEELGIEISGSFTELTPVKQKGGKIVYAWALEADIDPGKISSNTFDMEWPPRSGKKQSFPEIDKAAWFSIGEAKEKMNSSQAVLIDELVKILRYN